MPAGCVARRRERSISSINLVRWVLAAAKPATFKGRMPPPEKPRRRPGDAKPQGQSLPLTCSRCGGGLRLRGDAMVCPRRHVHEGVDGIYDLWPSDHVSPRLDPFSTPYGAIYDRGIKERSLARLAGRLGWGADVDEMFRLMDVGVKCDPG